MRVKQQSEHGEHSTNSSQLLINQLREITSIQDPQILLRALNASQGDISHAVGLLTTQPAENGQGTPETPDKEGNIEAWEAQTDASPKDDLQTAIELSLQESQAEERELNRALEASVEDSAARVKRKRCEPQGESSSPADWIRQEDWPVGIRNVGNTCWFSAVIQSLFHLPVFRRLVLNYCLSERILEKCKSPSRNIAFMQELRCLFALMTGSTRRFVDPSAAVELLRDAFRTSEAQQDVSEFTHKLLDWLEDAFQLAANGNPEDKKENPMVQLFYGTFVAERIHEGKILSNIEQFGQYPLQVNGFNNLDECLEGAMVEGEIEALYSDQTISSGSERWFSTLPPVLTFELSRFEFNQSLGRPEKIHKKLEFPQIIYMDRYLHKNNEQTHSRRGEAKKLKEQLTVLQQKLECYRHYGSGPVKYPLADMLQYVLEFACTKPSSVSPAEDTTFLRFTHQQCCLSSVGFLSQCQEPGEAGPSDGPACQQQPPLGQRTPIYKPFTQCRPIMDSPPHPAPHCVAEEELRFVKTCLQRWRTEVENNINELKASIDRVSQELEGMYSDNSLCQVPYRLHAVLVHEGQASAGHYWAYIYDHHNQHWMKYNDVIVTESSWEELVRDSYGGITNASAYCLMYINDNLPHLIAEDTDNETGQATKGMDSLPAVLRRYVREDNRWFQQELKDWEEQFCQPPRDEPAAPTAASPSPCGPSQDQPAEPGHALEPTGEQEQEPEAEPQLPPPRSLSPAAETSGQAQAAAVIPDPSTGVSPEADGRPEVTEARGEAAEAPDSQVDGTDGQDASAASTRRHQQSEDMVSEVEIPNVGKILVRADTDGYNEEMMLTPAMQGIIMAIAKARQVFDSDGPEAGLIKAFHEEYSRLFELSQEETTPQRDPRLHHALVYFFQNQAPNRVIERTLLEGFTDRNLSFDDRVREALNYLNHAYKDNAMLLRRGDRRGVDQSLIALHRRRCLKVNDNAAMLFRSSEVSDVEDGVVIMNEAVIPCMQLMSRPDTVSQEDLDTMEAIRSHWCSYLGVDLEDSLQEKLGEFLPRVLDCSTEMVVLKDPPTVRSKVPHDLCSRLAAIMESITNTSAVAVK
uniref:USP domain-containing protein n=1 Tax=Esox lucius TaxID=8010 RepID=A0A6Q2XF56_ESOLU